jgi:hypothetical protein
MRLSTDAFGTDASRIERRQNKRWTHWIWPDEIRSEVLLSCRLGLEGGTSDFELFLICNQPFDSKPLAVLLLISTNISIP